MTDTPKDPPTNQYLELYKRFPEHAETLYLYKKDPNTMLQLGVLYETMRRRPWWM